MSLNDLWNSAGHWMHQHPGQAFILFLVVCALMAGGAKANSDD